MITCKICNKRFKRLTSTHLKTQHSLSYSEYLNIKICSYENVHIGWKCTNAITHDPYSNYCILHDHELFLTERSFSFLKNEGVPEKIIEKLKPISYQKFKG